VECRFTVGRAPFWKGRAKKQKESCLFLEKVINCIGRKAGFPQKNEQEKL
jgi:hypothetical protein